MSFGFPAYYRRELKVSDLDEFREKLKRVLAELPFLILRQDNDRIILKVGWTIWSWGENIIIDLSKNGQVTVLSKCVFPLQCIDYGKNKENVELLFERLQ